jgi:hypothetical protein
MYIYQQSSRTHLPKKRSKVYLLTVKHHNTSSKALNIDALSLYSYKRNVILNIMNDLHVTYILQQYEISLGFT